MITAFTYEDSYKFGSIVTEVHKLRYRAFIQRMSYAVPFWNQMEYDQYDNITTVYLAYRLDDGSVGGICRLAPTDRAYMIKDLWPELVTKMDLPHSSTIWEASRLCVDHHLPAPVRGRIVAELIMAYQEYCLENNIEYMIGVMPPKIWDRVFVNNGWDIEYIGPEIWLNNEELVVAGKLNVSPFLQRKIQATTGLVYPIIEEGINTVKYKIEEEKKEEEAA